MSSSRNTAIISREYKDDPDYCVRALAVLLKAPGGKQGGPTNRPYDVERKPNELDAAPIIPAP